MEGSLAVGVWRAAWQWAYGGQLGSGSTEGSVVVRVWTGLRVTWACTGTTCLLYTMAMGKEREEGGIHAS